MTWPLSRRESLIAAAALAVAAWHFATATTFFGDDHVFLAYARFSPYPWDALFADRHGGEYYRPLPMALWWLLGRAEGGRAAFAVLALALHAAAAALVAALVADASCRRTGLLAGLLFLLAPSTREAASWFSASTDLCATVATLGSLLLLRRHRVTLSAVVALAAYLSKETALALPLLAAVVRVRPLKALAPHAALGAAVLAARFAILGGWGGSGDETAGGLGKAIQIASGVFHAASTHSLPEWLAWGLGLCLLTLGAWHAVRAAREGDTAATQPILWLAASLLPLGAAPWIVGSRYFYLPAVGIVWLVARPLARAGGAAVAIVLLVVAGAGFVEGELRRADVVSYDRRVDAARRAVVDGVGQGHRVFHVSAGVKDLDLAVKADAVFASAEREILILGDVPASFVLVPDALRGPADFLLARPPLPPGGAYAFGDRRIVGLARRPDAPGLEDVIAAFPGIRFIRLRAVAGGQVIARDMTGEVLRGVRADYEMP